MNKIQQFQEEVLKEFEGKFGALLNKLDKLYGANAERTFNEALSGFLLSALRKQIEMVRKEIKKLKYPKNKDGLYTGQDGTGIIHNIGYVEGNNDAVDDILSLLSSEEQIKK